SDPIGTGLVASLARPGGNVTGISVLGTELSGKRVELLREIMPDLTAAAVLWASNDPPAALALKETEDAARKLGIALEVVGLREAREIDGAFAALAGGRAQALIVLSSPMTGVNARQIAELAVQHRLPSVGFNRQLAERGFLITYGSDLNDVIRRAAHYVDKILRGARPEDLPVEQTTKIEFALNLATARALGLTVPPALLARADEVIE
ncbi:MAG TPA: ABC transporter substrate-binding protein, partial [Reyranella sp.]|nr:ABC transporter substrate-binding protein [Reyranella sp.]